MLTYNLVVSRGYVRLVRRGGNRLRSPVGSRFVRRDGEWVPWTTDDETVELAAEAADELQREAEETMLLIGAADLAVDTVVEAALDEARHPGRGDRGQSARSRMNMRRLFVSLPWERVGPRPALISLTYPGVWPPWVPDGRTWEGHRRAFERRWVRRWGEPLVGVLVKEFQVSGRPHLHLYVGLPTGVGDDDFTGLRDRTMQRHRLERLYGRFEGRRHTPPLAVGSYGGEFGTWLLRAWSEIIGTDRADAWQRIADPSGSDHHRIRGADVAVMFWSDQVEASTDRTRVAQYLAREAGKFAQKQPPPGFRHTGRFYGVWGRSVGFRPEATAIPLDPAVAVEVEVRLARWVNWRLRVLRRGAPPTNAMAVRRPGDGVTAFGLGPDQAARIVRWSEQAAARRRARGIVRSAGGAAPGVGDRPMQDPRRRAAQIVRAHVAEPGFGGSSGDDRLNRTGLLERVPPRQVPGNWTGLLSADHRVGRSQRPAEGVDVAVQVVVQERPERRTDRHLARLALLADPLDDRFGAELEVADDQADDLGDPQAGESEPEDDLVPSPEVGIVAGADQLPVSLVVSQPPGRVLTLQLPLQRRRRPQRIVPALQLLQERRIGCPLADTPPQERAHPGQPPPPRVVGSGLGDVAVDRHIGEAPSIDSARKRKQGRQLGPVLMRSLRIGVPAHETLDERRCL